MSACDTCPFINKTNSNQLASEPGNKLHCGPKKICPGPTLVDIRLVFYYCFEFDQKFDACAVTALSLYGPSNFISNSKNNKTLI